jgi:hypothetical protein
MRSTRVGSNWPYTTADVYVRRRGRVYRVNPPGTHAQTGGISRGALIVQVADGGRARLARYDLAARRLTYLPAFVNDGAWLWRPDADGDLVLYGATRPGTHETLRYEIRLANLRTHRVRVLAAVDGHAQFAAPGQLRGSWATWISCPESTCNVWRENLRTGVATPAPDPHYLAYTQVAPAVDTRGVVYFERTFATCGGSQILRWDGRSIHVVRTLPRQTAYGDARLTKDGRDLFFDLGPCARAARDDIDAVSVAGRRTRRRR